MANHRHYSGCGHVYRSNMWIYDDGGPIHGETVVVVQGHVHNDHCGHFYYNGGWYMSNGHHHGPGCGHVNQGGRWVFVEVETKQEVRKAGPAEKHDAQEARRDDHKAEVEERKVERKPYPPARKEEPRRVEEKGPPATRMEDKAPPKKEEAPAKKNDNKGSDKNDDKDKKK